MPNILTIASFQKANELNIPLAISVPNSASNVSPNETARLTELITVIEKSILLNALGVELYNLLQTALADLDNADQRFKDLVNGLTYDGKVWEGLDNDYSLLAYRVYEMFVTQTNDSLSAIGVTKVNGENQALFTPKYRIANANQKFIAKYQGEYLMHPKRYNVSGIDFIDWFGYGDETEVSLYRFLFDKQTDYPEWKPEFFKAYDVKNSFGL
jgi:hypothetical protein